MGCIFSVRDKFATCEKREVEVDMESTPIYMLDAKGHGANLLMRSIASYENRSTVVFTGGSLIRNWSRLWRKKASQMAGDT